MGLVVLGRHPDPPLIRLLTRNIVDEVLRTTTIPLCVVRRQRTGTIYNRILVPVVDDDLSRIATAYATGLAKAFGSTVLFCTFGGTAGDATAQLLERTKNEALAAGVEADGLVLERGGKLSGAIVRNAYAQGCDAIVMATRAREGLPILAEGSVTEAVVRTSDLPVIAVRGEG